MSHATFLYPARKYSFVVVARKILINAKSNEKFRRI